MIIPVAAIPADPAVPVGPTRWLIACDMCGAWSPHAANQRKASAAARAAGWTFATHSTGRDLCPTCTYPGRHPK